MEYEVLKKVHHKSFKTVAVFRCKIAGQHFQKHMPVSLTMNYDSSDVPRSHRWFYGANEIGLVALLGVAGNRH